MDAFFSGVSEALVKKDDANKDGTVRNGAASVSRDDDGTLVLHRDDDGSTFPFPFLPFSFLSCLSFHPSSLPRFFQPVLSRALVSFLKRHRSPFP
jgi:hypothetical protein